MAVGNAIFYFSCKYLPNYQRYFVREGREGRNHLIIMVNKLKRRRGELGLIIPKSNIENYSQFSILFGHDLLINNISFNWEDCWAKLSSFLHLNSMWNSTFRFSRSFFKCKLQKELAIIILMIALEQSLSWGTNERTISIYNGLAPPVPSEINNLCHNYFWRLPPRKRANRTPLLLTTLFTSFTLFLQSGRIWCVFLPPTGDCLIITYLEILQVFWSNKFIWLLL